MSGHPSISYLFELKQTLQFLKDAGFDTSKYDMIKKHSGGTNFELGSLLHVP